jgi:hypothetical protein
MRAAGLIFILFLSLYIPQSPGTAQKQVAGNWLGMLEVSGLKLRILLKITQGADGKLSAKFDSVDRGPKIFPSIRLARKTES